MRFNQSSRIFAPIRLRFQELSTRGKISIACWFSIALILAVGGIALYLAHSRTAHELLRFAYSNGQLERVQLAHLTNQLEAFGDIALIAWMGVLGIVFIGFGKALAYFTNPVSRFADIIAASIYDGIILLKGEQILYANPTGERILGLEKNHFGVYENRSIDTQQDSEGLKAVMKAAAYTMPVEYSLEADERRFHYLIQSFRFSADLVDKVENSVGRAVENLLNHFQADTLVLAQDVTIVRESQEAKSHFLATLSHEVKTPVTSLTMATRLLKRSIGEVPNPSHRNLILTCAEDVDRLRGLVDDLMTVSRFDALTQRLELQTIDLGKLFVHSIQSFQPQAKARGIQLVQEMRTQTKRVILSVDATKIAWAFSNLLINALRHTPRGGKVEVVILTFDDRVEVRVSDTGPGIDRHRQEKIFDKYNSYYDLRVARSGSAGVGLAIAREIVVAHGGRIWVNSGPGQGAQFCFNLPVKRVQEGSSSQKPIHASNSMEVKGACR